MDYKQLMKDIKNNDLGRLYLFCGEEFLLGKMMLESLQKSIIAPQYEQLNVTYLDGRSVSTNDIKNSCETLPFMDQRRLIVVNNCSLLHGASTASPKDVDALCAYIGNMLESSCLVFVNKEIDKKRKLYKALVKHGTIVEYNKLEKSDLSKWITKRMRIQKKTIEGNALALFIESSDYLNKDSKVNLSNIENEIDKVLAFTKDKDLVELCDVENSVQENMDTNVFKMLELMGMGSVSKSLHLLDILIRSGEPPIKILFMIVRQFRIIYYSKLLMDAGYSTNDIAKAMGERPFVVTKALSQAQKFSYKKLKNIYEYAAKVDIKMKSSQINAKLALEMLLIKAS